MDNENMEITEKTAKTASLENECNTEAKKKKQIDLSNESIVYLVLFSILEGILYSWCFAGYLVLPQLSFTIFCYITFFALTFTLIKIGYFKNKKALIFAIPIFVVSTFNAVFDYNFYSVTNVIVMHFLFAFYILKAVENEENDMFTFSYALKGVRTIFGNMTLFLSVYKKFINKYNEDEGNVLQKILIGLLISFPVLLLLIILLTSADDVFRNLTINFISDILTDFWHVVTFFLVFVFAIGYVVQAKFNSEKSFFSSYKKVKLDKVIAITFLSLINLLFLAFSIVQVLYLFRGGFMTLPEGMEYAQYAREGFFQLLFVTIINFSVIVLFLSFFDGAFKSKMIRFLLIMLCVFTSILIASSFYRMHLYTKEYGFTFLRNSVLTFLCMEVFLIIITLIKLFDENIKYGKCFIIICFAFYMIVNVTGSDIFATYLNTNKYTDNKREYIERRYGSGDYYLTRDIGYDGQIYIVENIDESAIMSRYPVGKYQLQNWSYFKRSKYNKNMEEYWAY